MRVDNSSAHDELSYSNCYIKLKKTLTTNWSALTLPMTACDSAKVKQSMK